jgi:RNA polymerase sigma factor (sigma-70 family)
MVIDQVLAGDQERYAVLVDRYKSFAFTIAYKVLQSRPEAEEAAQDAFIKAFHYLKGFNREARFSTWLYRIVFNTAIGYKRKNRYSFQSIEDSSLEYHEGAGDALERRDKQRFITKAIDKLNEEDRYAIQLYYLQEFSLEEVAATMGKSMNTIKVRVHRARQRLAAELKSILKQEALTL